MTFLAPELTASRVNRSILGAQSIAWEVRVAALEEELKSKTKAVELAHDAYRADLARLRRLEDKLQGHLGYISALAPIATGVAAGLLSLSLNRSSWWLLLDAVIIIPLVMHLIAGFLLAREGVRSIALSLAERVTIERAVSTAGDIGARVAAEELVAMEYNEAIGLRLGNAISGVNAALAWAVWLLAIGAVALVIQLR